MKAKDDNKRDYPVIKGDDARRFIDKTKSNKDKLKERLDGLTKTRGY